MAITVIQLSYDWKDSKKAKGGPEEIDIGAPGIRVSIDAKRGRTASTRGISMLSDRTRLFESSKVPSMSQASSLMSDEGGSCLRLGGLVSRHGSDATSALSPESAAAHEWTPLTYSHNHSGRICV